MIQQCMVLKPRYETAKQRLLDDKGICTANRRLFARFFEYEEYKLKRQNGIATLDDSSYKTLLAYVTRLRTVNRWFKNEPWEKLTKQDIKRVYDDLEDGKIKSMRGTPLKDKETYYRMIIRSKPFEMAGKRELAKEVMEFYGHQQREEVRFIEEATFRQLVSIPTLPEHRAFLWLAWDIGENASSLLQLRKNDPTRQVNQDTNESEYLINLRRETLKRSRTPRSEFTNYRETVELLDLILKGKRDDEPLFKFGYRMAKKIIERAVRITGARCTPGGQKVTLKDLRSSMACDLLKKSWTTDEVNSRLGHKPSSSEIDRYVNFLALDRRKPKKKLHDHKLTQLTLEIQKMKDREKLYQLREQSSMERVGTMEKQQEKFQALAKRIEQLLPALRRKAT